MKLEKYIDLTEYGADYTLNSYLANGWRIIHQGLTLIILEKTDNYIPVIGLLGSLFGGLLISKAVGVKYKSSKVDIINGIIMSSIFIISLIYFAFMG